MKHTDEAIAAAVARHPRQADAARELNIPESTLRGALARIRAKRSTSPAAELGAALVALGAVVTVSCGDVERYATVTSITDELFEVSWRGRQHTFSRASGMCIESIDGLLRGFALS